jgi:hypothetical protein
MTIKTTLRGKPLLTLALLALAGVMLFGSIGLSPVGRLVPLTVLVVTVALLLAELVLDLSPGFVQRHPSLEKDVFGIERVRQKAREDSASDGRSLGRREFDLCIWLVSLPGLIYLLGCLIALPLFTLLYLWRRSREGWRVSITIALGMFLVLFGLWSALAQTPLSDGWLWTRLGL